MTTNVATAAAVLQASSVMLDKTPYATSIRVFEAQHFLQILAAIDVVRVVREAPRVYRRHVGEDARLERFVDGTLEIPAAARAGRAAELIRPAELRAIARSRIALTAAAERHLCVIRERSERRLLREQRAREQGDARRVACGVMAALADTA